MIYDPQLWFREGADLKATDNVDVSSDPWEIAEFYGSIGHGKSAITGEEHAAYVLKAVQCHQKLLDALIEASKWGNDFPDDVSDTVSTAICQALSE